MDFRIDTLPKELNINTQKQYISGFSYVVDGNNNLIINPGCAIVYGKYIQTTEPTVFQAGEFGYYKYITLTSAGSLIVSDIPNYGLDLYVVYHASGNYYISDLRGNFMPSVIKMSGSVYLTTQTSLIQISNFSITGDAYNERVGDFVFLRKARGCTLYVSTQDNQSIITALSVHPRDTRITSYLVKQDTNTQATLLYPQAIYFYGARIEPRSVDLDITIIIDRY